MRSCSYSSLITAETSHPSEVSGLLMFAVPNFQPCDQFMPSGNGYTAQ